MLSPTLQELEINIMNETRCSDIMLETYDPLTRLCFENTDSGTCLVGCSFFDGEGEGHDCVSSWFVDKNTDSGT